MAESEDRSIVTHMNERMIAGTCFTGRGGARSIKTARDSSATADAGDSCLP